MLFDYEIRIYEKTRPKNLGQYSNDSILPPRKNGVS